MRHTGPKPPGQNRSLRSIVEEKSDAGNFPNEAATPDAGRYADSADAARPNKGGQTPGPAPITKKRGA